MNTFRHLSTSYEESYSFTAITALGFHNKPSPYTRLSVWSVDSKGLQITGNIPSTTNLQLTKLGEVVCYKDLKGRWYAPGGNFDECKKMMIQLSGVPQAIS